MVLLVKIPEYSWRGRSGFLRSDHLRGTVPVESGRPIRGIGRDPTTSAPDGAKEAGCVYLDGPLSKQFLDAHSEECCQPGLSVRTDRAFSTDYEANKGNAQAGTIGDLTARVGARAHLDGGRNSPSHACIIRLNCCLSSRQYSRGEWGKAPPSLASR